MAVTTALRFSAEFMQELAEHRSTRTSEVERLIKRTRMLPLNVDITVLAEGEGTFSSREGDSENTVTIKNWPEVQCEWRVFEWYPGHYMKDARANYRIHDGRHIDAQSNLWHYILNEGCDHFVSSVSAFLWEVLTHSAIAACLWRRGEELRCLAADLGIMCKHGRHRSLGWAFLTAQVLMMLGVNVKLVVGLDRLCYCTAHCKYDVDPRNLPGISGICEKIEVNIAERTQTMSSSTCRHADEVIDVIAEEYIEWIDFFWD
jgi:hypothetical protein